LIPSLFDGMIDCQQDNLASSAIGRAFLQSETGKLRLAGGASKTARLNPPGARAELGQIGAFTE
jgi:hypothetical protein